MSFDELTDKEELELACAADELEQSLHDAENVMPKDESVTEPKLNTTVNKGGAVGKPSQFSISYQQGDLFSCPKTDSLAHCVSKDLRMGKGIAVLFKEKFDGISELKIQANRVGDVAILKRDERFIYYLITKPRYNNKPTYQDLETTLRGMKFHCVKHGVKRLSMPKIGCGLDRLQWSQVEGLLSKVFGDTDLIITVYTI